MSHNIYRGSFLFTLVCAPENVEGAGVRVALVDVHHPEVNIQSTGSPAMQCQHDLAHLSRSRTSVATLLIYY